MKNLKKLFLGRTNVSGESTIPILYRDMSFNIFLSVGSEPLSVGKCDNLLQNICYTFSNHEICDRAPLAPVTMLNNIKMERNHVVITCIICQGQHCFGGEGGNIDYDVTLNKKVTFFRFLQV